MSARRETHAPMTPAAPTIEEHGEFLTQYVRLQLWFLWTWLRAHPLEDFRFAIRNRVDIFRKTDLNEDRSKNTATPGNLDDPRWIELEATVQRIYLREQQSTADAFEQEAWNVFRPVVEARVARDFNEDEGMDEYQCGSLRYDAPKRFLSHRLTAGLRHLKHGRPSTVFFHVGNRLSPQSIFSDPEYLPRCFFELMEQTKKRFYAGALTTHTWLNSYPRWLSLFPQQWQENLSPPDDVDWSQSSWGQFITARGTFNYKHAEILRQTGRLPYCRRSSWCSFANMEEHLRRLLQVQ